ncbi:MAG: hypothetical protein ABF614_00520 [Bifidobacterium psychraerophilum]
MNQHAPAQSATCIAAEYRQSDHRYQKTVFIGEGGPDVRGRVLVADESAVGHTFPAFNKTPTKR